MAKYRVTQVNGETSTGNKQDARRSWTTDESGVSAGRAWINNRTRNVPAESSDWAKVERI